MSAAGRPAAQSRLRAIVARSGDGEAAAELETLIAKQPAPAPGQRTPATLAALATRDAALVELHRLGFTAAEIAQLLSRYAGTAWPRDAGQPSCPERLLGTPLEFCWRALKAIPHAVRKRQILAVIGREPRSELPQFIARGVCDGRSRREIDQCDSETKRVEACRRL
jgi:hypothetical protein